VQVLHGVVVHVQRLVGMVMVVAVLAVHCQMRYFSGSLRYRHWAKRRHGLPQKDKYQGESAKTARHRP